MKTRTVTLKELVQSESALARLVTLPLSARMTITFSETMRVVAPILEDHRKVQATLVKKYRKPAVEGKEEEPAKFTEENTTLLDSEYADLLKKTYELPFGKIKLSSLLAEKIGSHKEGDKTVDDFLKLSGAELFALSWLIRVDDTVNLFENEDG